MNPIMIYKLRFLKVLHRLENILNLKPVLPNHKSDVNHEQSKRKRIHRNQSGSTSETQSLAVGNIPHILKNS